MKITPKQKQADDRRIAWLAWLKAIDAAIDASPAVWYRIWVKKKKLK